MRKKSASGVLARHGRLTVLAASTDVALIILRAVDLAATVQDGLLRTLLAILISIHHLSYSRRMVQHSGLFAASWRADAEAVAVSRGCGPGQAGSAGASRGRRGRR